MPKDTLADPRPPRAADDPCYAAAPPGLVLVRGPDAAARDRLERAVMEAGCRVFSSRDAAGDDVVVAGRPQALGRLRSLLAGERALDSVREAVEAHLGHLAAPDGLPRLCEDGQRLTEVAPDEALPEGTTLRISRDFQFDAAHNLPRYNGKCERLHGHTFHMRVSVDAPVDGWSGMAFDFHDLKEVVKGRVVDVLDHTYLNEVIPNPSAEHIAIWAWQRLSDLPLHEITVWETPSCSVTYSGPPRGD